MYIYNSINIKILIKYIKKKDNVQEFIIFQNVMKTKNIEQ